jgi:hypothetical protein
MDGNVGLAAHRARADGQERAPAKGCNQASGRSSYAAAQRQCPSRVAEACPIAAAGGNESVHPTPIQTTSVGLMLVVVGRG